MDTEIIIEGLQTMEQKVQELSEAIKKAKSLAGEIASLDVTVSLSEKS